MDRLRTTLALGLTLVMGCMAIGCAQCASPYDYCGPTFTGECGDQCNALYRAGSILSGGYGPMMYDESYEEGEIYYEDGHGQYEGEPEEVAPVSYEERYEQDEPGRLALPEDARPLRRAVEPRGGRTYRR